MDKCVLSKSSNCGIHILKNYSSRVMISNCQLSQACYFGIKAAASQTEVQVIDCTMKENRQYGAGVLPRAHCAVTLLCVMTALL